MVPSSANAAGLPSNPRSAPTGWLGREEPDHYNLDHYSAALPSRQVRTQKSILSIPRERSRSRPPPIPESRQPRLTNNSRSYNERPEPSSYRRSNESSSSSNSSLLDRVKVGAGYASSRTSFEDDELTSRSKWRPDNQSRSLRDRRMAREEPTSQEDELDKSTSGTGDGYTIWSRVATAASTMTVSVGKAWATNVTAFAGEETPPGQESRLIHAMKAYHLAKARDPTDLPTWLFDEHERRAPPSRPRDGSRDGDEYEVVEKSFIDPPKPRGLRDIYEAAASTNSTSSVRSDRPVARSYADEGAPSKATDRLKALRDAKRNALSYNTLPNHQVNERSGDRRRETDRDGLPGGTDQRSARVGLPSGPIGRSRRL